MLVIRMDEVSTKFQNVIKECLNLILNGDCFSTDSNINFNNEDFVIKAFIE